MTNKFSPQRCALVIVDVQNDFCHPDGALASYGVDTTPARALLPIIRRLTDVAREHDIPRIYLRVEHDEWSDDPAWLARSSASGPIDLSSRPLTRTGSWGAQLYQLSPTPDELVISKPRHSGFAYTALALALRAKNRDTVLLAGVATNICIRSTAVDAVAQGLHPVLLTDATGAFSATEHETTVREFPAFYGPALTSSELFTTWNSQKYKRS